MNTKKIISVFFISYCLTCFALGDTQGEINSGLQIYLPREITIQESTLLLGQVGIARGHESLVKKANLVTLGCFSMPGQEIVIPRNTILSRLASSGISASNVTFMGAEEVTVKQKHQIVSGDYFTNLADDFLKKNISGNSISGWKAVRAAQELIIPDDSKDIKYYCSFDKNIRGSQVNVEITVFSGDKKIGSRNAVFRLEYESRTPVAVVDIEQGTVLSSENVKIEKRPSGSPEPEDWKLPYGLLAKRAILANTVIRDNMVGSSEPQTVIKRNQNVIIRIEKPGFVITAVGKTMQDGKAGDFIKARNVDSQRIIIVKVNEDGTVEPVS
jgi:flagella basal body P-ring formation protein FlgA